MSVEVRPLAKKWFGAAAPVNFEEGYKVEIGSGENGKITIVDPADSSLKVQVVVPDTASASLSATFASHKITVNLGTDASKAADATKNTATLIAAAINAIASATWTATASGTGATAITGAISAKAVEAYKVDGTPCPVAPIVLKDDANNAFYVCTKADNTKKNNGWKSASLSNL